jgi:hypothetical protein
MNDQAFQKNIIPIFPLLKNQAAKAQAVTKILWVKQSVNG